MTERSFVVGVGLTRFEKPGARAWDYPDMAREAGQRALADAGIDYGEVQEAYVGYCYGDSTSGQRAVYELGLSGVPIFNVNNNCATGSTALFLARRAVRNGSADCVLALGFEKMAKGSLGSHFQDRSAPLERHYLSVRDRHGIVEVPFAVQMFARAAQEYVNRYGIDPEVFARIAAKNHRHSADNPYSQFREVYSLAQIQSAPTVMAPLTKLQCCPTSDGGGAALIASERFVARHGLWDRAVEILGQAMVTDRPDSFDGSDIALVGSAMSAAAAAVAYAEAGLGPEDAQVIELHDCFAPNELFSYEALGLSEVGQGAELVYRQDNSHGGRWVVNPSGGLLSKGHPLGATGLAQCAELVWQLRGQAERRQVPDARVAIQHNAGLGGACVVGVYGRPRA